MALSSTHVCRCMLGLCGRLQSMLGVPGTRSMSSRFLKESTAVRRQAQVVKQMDVSVEREMKRLEKMKKSKEKKNLILEFHKKSVVLNQSFKMDLGLVLKKISALSGLGMVLTKVKTDEQFSYVHIYWSANTVQNESVVASVLNDNDSLLRTLIKQRFGEIPETSFIHDTNYIHGATMEKLFNKIKTDLNLDAQESCLDRLYALTLEADVFGLNRDNILKMLDLAKEKTKAKHRFNPIQQAEFTKNYLQSIEQHGGEKRKEKEKLIKKFLRERNAVRTGSIEV